MQEVIRKIYFVVLKKTNRKGQGLVEFALLCAFCVGVGLFARDVGLVDVLSDAYSSSDSIFLSAAIGNKGIDTTGTTSGSSGSSNNTGGNGDNTGGGSGDNTGGSGDNTGGSGDNTGGSFDGKDYNTCKEIYSILKPYRDLYDGWSDGSKQQVKDKWIADGKPLTDNEERFMKAAIEYIWNPNEYSEDNWQDQTSAHAAYSGLDANRKPTSF